MLFDLLEFQLDKPDRQTSAPTISPNSAQKDGPKAMGGKAMMSHVTCVLALWVK